MLDRAAEWCASHPKVIVGIMAFVVVDSIYTFHKVLSWAESLEQIEASEFYGG